MDACLSCDCPERPCIHTVAQGFNLIAWPMEYLSGRLSLRVQQLEVGCQTKTKDNVFVTLVVVIQYQVSARLYTCKVAW